MPFTFMLATPYRKYREVALIPDLRCGRAASMSHDEHLSTRVTPVGAERGATPNASQMPIKIMARKNGPYLVSGDLAELQLTDADGNLRDLAGKANIALCRCGGSVSKPFCDGTHSRIGFQAAESAVDAQAARESGT
ncbi:MAG: hypothetical protein NVS4B13_00460 [Candidatus Elarobacter sp.]